MTHESLLRRKLFAIFKFILNSNLYRFMDYMETKFDFYHKS